MKLNFVCDGREHACSNLADLCKMSVDFVCDERGHARSILQVYFFFRTWNIALKIDKVKEWQVKLLLRTWNIALKS